MRPDFLAVGHVTLDQVSGGARPGGAAYYAALAAHRLGLRAGVLTSCGPDFPPEAWPAGVDVARVDAPATTCFEHEQGPGGRRLRLLARGADLTAGALPPAWARTPLVLLCPVAGEVEPDLAAAFPDASLGVAAQGWLRRAGPGGRVETGPWVDSVPVLARAQVLALSLEDAGGDEAAIHQWVQRVPVAAVTLGARGAILFVSGERYHVEPDPAREVDATGAGDVFAAVLLIDYHRTGDPWEAAAAAACAAAASVEGPGASTVADRAALDARLRGYRERRGG